MAKALHLASCFITAVSVFYGRLLSQVGKMRGGQCSSRPNEFIVALHKLDKDGNVKGAKRRGVPREPLIFLDLSSIQRRR